MEAFLRASLPRLLAERADFEVYPHQGKDDLLGKLGDRLRGYAAWLPDDWRIVVVLDRDDDDCTSLKRRMERFAADAGLATRTRAGAAGWRVVNRVAIEELESWYFGDWEAVRTTFPRLSPSIPQQAGFRNPDAIAGGTWEAFERVLKHAGHCKGGLRKTEVARALGQVMDLARNQSRSFAAFRDAVIEAVSC